LNYSDNPDFFIPDSSAFRDALLNLSTENMMDYIPYIGNDISFDLLLLDYLKSQVEANTLDLALIYEKLGSTPRDIFYNDLNNIIYNSMWLPSDMYPTYDSFSTDMIQRFIKFELEQIDY